jgi:L-aspartate oxidase
MPADFAADVLIVGAGAAGLCAAIAAAPRRVLLIAPSFQSATCTELAQGGIAAPVSANDSVISHVRDTLRAAAFSGSQPVSEAIISAARPAIEFLSAIGVDFDQHDSQPDLHLEAGHSLARILHAEGDGTGAALHAALLGYARQCAHIEFLSSLQAVSLLQDASGIAGVQALHDTGHVVLLHARDTVLATGGVGQLFAATTNGVNASGEGLAIALAHGAAVAGLEFVQFHPTALHCARDPLPLLTEALRGAGAVLVANGRRFMRHIHPDAELAPRDVVARAVWREQQAGHDVWLDARALFEKRRDNFPGADAACRAEGVDAALAPIPVTCAAHFHMGGIRADVEGRSSLPHLWACGEVACTGLHGANRLASNSLLEAVVVGNATGKALASKTSSRCIVKSLRPDVGDIDRFDAQQPTWPALRHLMSRSLGPVREADAMQSALQRINGWLSDAPTTQRQLHLRLQLAQAMLRAALLRRESRGAHWRSDYPERNRDLDGPQALWMPASSDSPYDLPTAS